MTKVKNVVLTAGGRHYLHAVIQIEKQTEGDAKNVIMAAFAAHTSLKHVVVVDEDIDVYDTDDIEFAIATRVKGDLDVMVIPNVRGSSLNRVPVEERHNNEGRRRCNRTTGRSLEVREGSLKRVCPVCARCFSTQRTKARAICAAYEKP